MVVFAVHAIQQQEASKASGDDTEWPPQDSVAEYVQMTSSDALPIGRFKHCSFRQHQNSDRGLVLPRRLDWVSIKLHPFQGGRCPYEIGQGSNSGYSR